MTRVSTHRSAHRACLALSVACTVTLLAGSVFAMLPPRYHFAKKVGRIGAAEAARRAANTVVVFKVTNVSSKALPAGARRTMTVARIPSTVTGQVTKSLRGTFRAGQRLTFTMTEVRQLAPGPTRFSDRAPAVGRIVTAHLNCAGQTCKKAVAYLGFLSDAQFAAQKKRAQSSAQRHGAQPAIRPAIRPVRRLRCNLRQAAAPGMVCLRYHRPQITPPGWQPGCNTLSGRKPGPSVKPAGPRVVCRKAPAGRKLKLHGASRLIERFVDHRRKRAPVATGPEPMCRISKSASDRGCVWVEIATARAKLAGRVRKAYERAGWRFQCAGRNGLLLCQEQASGQRAIVLPALPRR
ncbi:MAG: hypothetical protein KC502_17510 [Myxococcales bacterium]|nr:hypothetical protein [Myxococcales bacterium]